MSSLSRELMLDLTDLRGEDCADDLVGDGDGPLGAAKGDGEGRRGAGVRLVAELTVRVQRQWFAVVPLH